MSEIATRTFLTDEPIDRDALIAEAMRRSDGALVVFAGAVRNHHDGHAVEAITYEAYRPMAEKEIAKIVEDVEARYRAVAVALQHRLGFLEVGEESIVIICSSPHRAEAFAAARELIDRIKETVPIWKKERGPDGEEWVGWQWC